MNVHCADCDHTFLLSPDGMTQNAACENCGGKRLERGQPIPTNSNGDLRNTVVPQGGGIGLDQGGNPLQEGIWGQVDGGWQPFRRRDESFASVRTANVPPHRFEVAGMLHNGNLSILPFFDAHINGVSVRDPNHSRQLYTTYGNPQSPQFNTPVQVAVHDPAHVDAVRHLIEEGSRQMGTKNVSRTSPITWATIKAIANGRIAPPPGINPQQLAQSLRPEDPASVTAKVAIDFGFDFGQNETLPTHKFIIDRSGNVYSGANPTTHEEIANKHRLHDLNFPHEMSLGELNSDNTADWYQHDTGHSPQALESMLYGHFGKPVVIDPNLKPSTNEERWGITPGGYVSPRGQRELEVLNQAPLPRSYGVPLDRNEGLVRGGRTLNMDPYLPWTHEGYVKEGAFLAPLVAPAIEALGIGGAEAGAGGLVSGLMGRALQGIGSGGVRGLMGGGGQQAAPTQGPISEPPPRSLDQLSHVVTADIETPHTNPGYHDTDDGDTKQFDDQSNDLAFQNPELGPGGGATQGEDNVPGGIGSEQPTFTPGSLERAHMLLPSILDYAHSEKSGIEDPMLRALHEQLEKEHPGYLEKGDDAAVEQYLQKLREPQGVTAGAWDNVPDTADVRPQTVNYAPGQGVGKCVYCGGGTGPDGSCGQCGAKNNPVDQQTYPGAQHPPSQGPPQPYATPMPGYTGAALPQVGVPNAGLGIQQGHCEHCGGVTDASGHCPQCGAQVPSIEGQGQGVQAPNIQTPAAPGYANGGRVAADHQGPATDAQKKAVAELLIDSGRHEEIPHMLEAPWDYAKELAQVANKPNVVPNLDPNEQAPPAPPQEIAPPGATMPVPNPADPSQQGQMVSKVAGPEDGHNPVAVPAADQEGQPDVSQEQDSSHTWQDDQGQPLQVGQTYEMHNPKYQIPDVVQIVATKPDSITVETVGEFDPSAPSGEGSIGYKHEITKREADIESLTFVPRDGSQEPIPEQAQQDPTAPPAPVNTQTEEVPNVPRQLSHVEAAAEEEIPDPDEFCPRCASNHFTSSMSSATTMFHECYKCANTWETKEEDYIDHNTASREWIKNDSSPGGDDFFAEYERVQAARKSGGSRSLADIAARDPRYQEVKQTLEANAQERTAGRSFTPREQREFIEEQGVARNADKLNLEGTHYESHRYLGDRVNGMNVPDSHLFLGI